MKNKVIKVFAFCLCFCLALLPFSVHAETMQTATLYAEDCSVNSGEIISVPVVLSNNTGLMGFGFEITYDSSCLTPVSVEATNLTLSGMLNDSIETANPGSFQVFWSATQNMTGSGEIFVLKFRASSKTTVTNTISFTTLQDDTFDEQYNDFPVITSNCTVTIIGNQSEYTSITLSGTDAFIGKETIISGTVDSSENKTEEIELNYNSTYFSFVSVSGAGNHTVSNISSTAGKVSFTLTTDANGDKKLFELHLMCKAEFNETTIYGNCLGDNPFYVIEPATVSYSGDAQIYSDEDISGKFGETVTVPVCISSNPGIMSYKLIFQYDKSLLKPISVINANLLSGYIENSISDNAGEFYIIWCGTSNQAKNGKIFDIEFEVLTKNKIETDINVSFSPKDTFDERYIPIPLTCSNIAITLNQSLICDGDFDGDIDANDLIIMVDALITDAKYSEILDANGDGIFNLLDLVRLKKHLADNKVPLGKIK